jgi:acetylornithine deacetylase/succinyl-diaminopimelate desuccinylase-like protein
MAAVHEYYRNNIERFVSEWKELLAFRSISADPSYHQECVECAAWLKQHLERIGFSAEVWESATKPVLFAERAGDPAKPAVLFYGHYDVQPVDPLELWTSEPFEGVIRDGRMYARGAEDNKGQLFFFCKALEALIASGTTLPTIKLLIEGEEESGSEALQENLAQWSERIAADVLMVCDTGMRTPGVPCVTMGLRGIAHCEVRVTGPLMDVHSGLFGGVVANPLHALSAILASLHRTDGSVAVPGFYDGVGEPTEQHKKLLQASPINVSEFEEFLGVPLAGGESRFSVEERRGLRPTLEINGIGGGYQGAGGKTIIPSSAFAKLSMRLVPGQNPERTLGAVVRYLEGCTIPGVKVTIGEAHVGGPALALSVDAPVLKKVAQAVKSEFGVEPMYEWEGASIPVIPLLARHSGAAPVLVGFGMAEDNIHSPNESFSLRQFEEGYRYVCAFLSTL